MKFLSRAWLVVLTLIPVVRADEAHTKAMMQVVDSLAKLDGVYVAVHTKKSPLKTLETELLAAREPLMAAAALGGLGADVSREIRACAALFEKSAQLMARDTAEETVKFFRAEDDLAELTRLAGRLGATLAPAARLTATERRELGQHVEARFGRKVLEFPRGDTSPFASGSRSAFAQGMWTINLAFDAQVKR